MHSKSFAEMENPLVLLQRVQEERPALLPKLVSDAQGRPKVLFAELAGLQEAASRLVALAASGELEAADPWEQVYSRVFHASLAGRMRELRSQLGLSFDYYDPDTTYEEDVRAFVTAMEDLIRQNRPLFAVLPD